MLRVFANAARSNMRGCDLVGRLGGEEFAVIVAEPMQFAVRIAERLRVSFETAGIQIGEHAIGATVSIGAACSREPVTNIAALIERADAALYRAKRDGRNRLYAADDRPTEQAAPIVVANDAQAAELARSLPRKTRVRRAKTPVPAAAGAEATTRLPYAR